MNIQDQVVLGFAIALTMMSAAAAQDGRVPAMPADSQERAAITLQVAGQPYRFEGKAVCQHAPVAYIYDLAAKMWSVQQSDGQRSITLTLWHPGSGSGDMFSLGVTTGARSYHVSTVKARGESTVQGSGKVTFTTTGVGGAFTINATTASGAAIAGTVKCSSFAAAVAEGGD